MDEVTCLFNGKPGTVQEWEDAEDTGPQFMFVYDDGTGFELVDSLTDPALSFDPIPVIG